MKRQTTNYLRALLAITLAVGLVLSSSSRMVAHNATELAKTFSEQHIEIEEHGHTHEDIVNVMYAYHGHGHDVADHDHNTAFLPPHASSGIMPPTRTNWALANSAMADRTYFDLDRPPRR